MCQEERISTDKWGVMYLREVKEIKGRVDSSGASSDTEVPRSGGVALGLNRLSKRQEGERRCWEYFRRRGEDDRDVLIHPSPVYN